MLAKTNARRISRALTVLLLMLAVPVHGQSSQTGKILSWDFEAYGKQGNVAVYYIQIGDTIYQVTRGTKKPEAGLESGQQVQCRIEKDDMFVSSGQIKELKFSIIGSAQ
ncbi:MAG: hypothetical protein ABSE45_10360 [Candidatus Acidiferrales bacterium]|jgi:hypothetical protein